MCAWQRRNDTEMLRVTHSRSFSISHCLASSSWSSSSVCADIQWHLHKRVATTTTNPWRLHNFVAKMYFSNDIDSVASNSVPVVVGGADISGTVVHTKKGIMGSAMQRCGGGHREWFVSFSDREWIFCYSFIFVWDPVSFLSSKSSSHFLLFLPSSFLGYSTVPAPKLPLPRDLVRVSLLSSLRRGVRGEARFGQPNLLNRWLGKRATDGERG